MKTITDLNEIDTSRPEGRYLLMAISWMTGQDGKKEIPAQIDTILKGLTEKALQIYGNQDKLIAKEIPKTFTQELAALLNKHSLENASDTPDFVLADYILSCLSAYAGAIRKRDKFFDFKPFNRKP